MRTSFEEQIDKLELSMAKLQRLITTLEATLQAQDYNDHGFRKQVSDIHKYIFTPPVIEQPKKRLTRQQRIESTIQQRLDEENLGLIKPITG